MPDTLYKDRAVFVMALDQAISAAGPLEPLPKLNASLRKAILGALSERDETAQICRDKKGFPEPDTELRDYENVPLNEDIRAYFEREVEPYVPEAWVDEGTRDHLDGEVGKIGYEINFNRYFYKYELPRPLEQIEAEIRELETEIVEMLKELTI
jgi:type I restriction enzyme M protein